MKDSMLKKIAQQIYTLKELRKNIQFLHFIYLPFILLLYEHFLFDTIFFESDLLKRLKLILFRSLLKLKIVSVIWKSLSSCADLKLRLDCKTTYLNTYKSRSFSLKLRSIHEKAIIYNQIPLP